MAAHFRIVSLCGSAGALPSFIEFLRITELKPSDYRRQGENAILTASVQFFVFPA